MEKEENLNGIIRFIDVIVAILLIAYAVNTSMGIPEYTSGPSLFQILSLFTSILIFISMYPYKEQFSTVVTVIASSIFLFLSSIAIGFTLMGIYNNELLFIVIPVITLIYCLLRGLLIIKK